MQSLAQIMYNMTANVKKFWSTKWLHFLMYDMYMHLLTLKYKIKMFLGFENFFYCLQIYNTLETLKTSAIYFSNLPVALMIITRLLCILICPWTLTSAYCLIGISHLCYFTTAWTIFHHLYQRFPYSFRSNLYESFTAFSQRSSFFFTSDIFCAVTFSPNYR